MPAGIVAIINGMSNDLKNKPRKELTDLVTGLGQKPYSADYIFSFIHQKHVHNIDSITPLSKTFRKQLNDLGYTISSISFLESQTDPDGTVKYLFGLPDGNLIETVRLNDNGRCTVCLSTQAGCRMGCLFCATGQIQFKRNLTAAEIADQVYQIETAAGPIDNLVYMGMGEPLDNFEEVLRSLEILGDPKGRFLGMRHITISTCGLAEGIERLAQAPLQPRLAVSLHAADEHLRRRLMPVARKEPLPKLFDALRNYQKKTGKRITFEYCMMKDVNDSPEDAAKLIQLIRGLKANVNLIEMNDFPGCPYQASPQVRIKTFAAILEKAGIETVIRFKRGRSILAACGQLGAQRLKTI
jgi:23S rRNA (adenine2503-C2)-methyltransferase